MRGLEYLGIGAGDVAELKGLYTNKLTKSRRFRICDRVGSRQQIRRRLCANSSGQNVRIPGNMKPHGVSRTSVTHALRSAVGWRSPIAGKVRVAGDGKTPACRNAAMESRGRSSFGEARRGSSLAAGLHRDPRKLKGRAGWRKLIGSSGRSRDHVVDRSARRRRTLAI